MIGPVFALYLLVIIVLTEATIHRSEVSIKRLSLSQHHNVLQDVYPFMSTDIWAENFGAHRLTI